MATTQLLRLAVTTLALVAATVALPNVWVAHAAGAHAYATPASAPVRSIAIVPGAAVLGGQPLGSLSARLETAVTLYRAGRVRAVFVSGNDVPGSPEVSVMRGWLLARGVPPADVLSDEHGSRTRNTMLDAVARYGINDAVVCTQDLYVDRAVFLAREAGIDAVGIGVASTVGGSWRNVGAERLKTALAFYESYLRAGPVPAAAPGKSVAVALR
jgi:vancomycin permeability regulator SanA